MRDMIDISNCNTLQHTATHCNIRASLIYAWSGRHIKLEHTETHCKPRAWLICVCYDRYLKLQHTQDTATHVPHWCVCDMTDILNPPFMTSHIWMSFSLTHTRTRTHTHSLSRTHTRTHTCTHTHTLSLSLTHTAWQQIHRRANGQSQACMAGKYHRSCACPLTRH